jgi:hypothetical protein
MRPQADRVHLVPLFDGQVPEHGVLARAQVCAVGRRIVDQEIEATLLILDATKYESGPFSGLVEKGSQFCRHPVWLMRVVWGCVPHSPNRYALRPWQSLRQGIEGIRQIPGDPGTAEKEHITLWECDARVQVSSARTSTGCPVFS